MRFRHFAAVSWAFFLFSLALTPFSFSAAEEKPYEVDCNSNQCVVDKNTYVGWRTYHANCHVCHGQDAIGSTFAPSLIDKLQVIDKERFMQSVGKGYKGEIGVMPGWEENPNVNKFFEELYAYLKARSDGVLLPGRPKKSKK